jgi:hypothetical protein
VTRLRHPAVDAVADLIRTQAEWVDTDDGRVRIHQPCLLQQLEERLYASSGGRGGSGGGAGTMPLNTQAWDLLVEIRHDAYSWADLLGVDARQYAAHDVPRAGKPTTPPLGKLLRACAVTAATTARDRVADAIASCARRWVRLIEEIVAEQPEQRDVRGVPCPTCDALGVHEERDDPGNRRRDDGRGVFSVPALVLVLPRDDEEPPVVYCRACGWSASLGGTEAALAAAAVARWAVVWSWLQLHATRATDDLVDAEPAQAA